MAKAKLRPPIEIAGVTVKAGSRESIDIPLPSFYAHSQVNMPVHVVHGRRPGPVLLVSAALHGDEINGTEIIRRLLGHRAINRVGRRCALIGVWGSLLVIDGRRARHRDNRRGLISRGLGASITAGATATATSRQEHGDRRQHEDHPAGSGQHTGILD